MTTYLPTTVLETAEIASIPFPCAASLTLSRAGDMRRDGEGRSAFYERYGIDPDLMWVVGQVHSRTVVVVPHAGADTGIAWQRTSAGEHFADEADGLVTAREDVTLAVTVADCMPIFIYDRETGARGLLHSGWKGTGILGRAVDVMTQEYGSGPGDLVVTLGPCICANCYEVDGERARLFAKEWGETAVKERDGRPYLDLRAANKEICRRRGIDRVNLIEHCTVQEPAFGSYRREGPEGYTLMLAIMGRATGKKDNEWKT